jgi:hypothetical protein
VEATATIEPARATMVCAVEASAQEAIAAQESTMTLIKKVEDLAAQAEREAWERVSRMEVESVAVLCSAHVESEVLA